MINCKSVEAIAISSEFTRIRQIGTASSSVRYASSVGLWTISVGPSASDPSGVIEVITVHRKGKSMIAAPARTAAYSQNLRIVHPPPLAADLEHRDHQDYREQDPGQCGSLTGPPVPEGQV